MSEPNNPFDFSGYASSPPPSGGPGGPVQPTWGAPDPQTQAGAPQAGAHPWGAPAPAPTAENAFAGVSTAQEIIVAKPPVLWVSLAAAAAVIGLVVAVVSGGGSALAIVAWVLAGPVAIGLLAVHTLIDTNRRASAVYSEPGWLKPAYWGVLAVAGVGILLSAWLIADWIGRS